MSDESYIQSLFSDRVGGSQFGKDTKIYKFEKIKRAKRGRSRCQSRQGVIRFRCR